MVLASRRAYKDATRWMKEARPPRGHLVRLAGNLFALSLAAGVVVLGAIALVSPKSYGSPGARAFGDAPVALVIGLMVALCAIGLAAKASRWLRDLRSERRRLLDHPASTGAADALAASSGTFKSRFAAGWVWGPPTVAVVATALAFSTVYFLIDALLARFDIGWEQPAIALGDALISFIAFRLVAGRLATFPLALYVYRSASEA